MKQFIFFALTICLSYSCTNKKAKENGLKNGWFYEWFQNGNLSKQAFYLNGELQGLMQEWNQQGELIIEFFFVNDTLKWYRRYIDGLLWYEEIYKADSVELFTSFHTVFSKTGEYKNGCENGKWITWHENGRKKSEEIYKYIKGFNPIIERDADTVSKGIFASKYRRSPKDGQWKFWYENGNLKREEYYIQEKKDSIWKYYSVDGKLIMEEKYKDGELTETREYK